MGSARLPGKSMILIGGKPSLQHLVDSLKETLENTQILIATSNLPIDDPIDELASLNEVKILRGDEENVASRFLAAAKQYPEFEYLIRICGDSPLFDHRVLSRVIDVVCSTKAKLVTTVDSIRGFPSGTNVEAFEAKFFQDCFSHFSSREDFEHVTSYFYRNATVYCKVIEKILPDFEFDRNLKLSLDTREDLERVLTFFRKIGERRLQDFTLESRLKII